MGCCSSKPEYQYESIKYSDDSKSYFPPVSFSTFSIELAENCFTSMKIGINGLVLDQVLSPSNPLIDGIVCRPSPFETFISLILLNENDLEEKRIDIVHSNPEKKSLIISKELTIEGGSSKRLSWSSGNRIVQIKNATGRGLEYEIVILDGGILSESVFKSFIPAGSSDTSGLPSKRSNPLNLKLYNSHLLHHKKNLTIKKAEIYDKYLTDEAATFGSAEAGVRSSYNFGVDGEDTKAWRQEAAEEAARQKGTITTFSAPSFDENDDNDDVNDNDDTNNNTNQSSSIDYSQQIRSFTRRYPNHVFAIVLREHKTNNELAKRRVIGLPDTEQDVKLTVNPSLKVSPTMQGLFSSAIPNNIEEHQLRILKQ